MKKLLSSVKGHCTSIGHSNEAATVARQKYFSLWHFFGAPAILMTFTPYDECSFRVELYAATEEHKVPGVNYIQDESKDLLDFNLRKKVRTRYAGACAIEYESVMQVVVRVLKG